MNSIKVFVASLDNAEVIGSPIINELITQGINAQLEVSSYGGFLVSQKFKEYPPDFVIIWLSGMGSTQGNTRPIVLDASLIAGALDQFLAVGARVLLIPPEISPRESDPFSKFSMARVSFISELRKLCSQNVIWFDLNSELMHLALSSWYAPQYWEFAKYPLHPDILVNVGAKIGNLLGRLLAPKVKGVLVDLDDTLWGGAVGDVGVSGVNLDRDAGGRPYLEMQSFLLELKEKGFFLGVASKNDARKAMEVFDKRREMMLSLADFNFFSASWNSKVNAVRDFAAKMNISVADVCFLDDSPFERNQVQTLLPNVLVPDLPEKASERVLYLNRGGFFVTPQLTKEDITRSKLMPVSATLQGADITEESLQEHLKGLRMSLEVRPITAIDSKRVFSLLHRVNQFNLTGYRPSPTRFESDLKKFDLSLALCYQDDLTESSIMGALLLSRAENYLVIENWVMSCRVFGRGFEWATAEFIRDIMREIRCKSVIVNFLETERNMPAKKILSQLEFVKLTTNKKNNASEVNANLQSFLLEIPEHSVSLVSSLKTLSL